MEAFGQAEFGPEGAASERSSGASGWIYENEAEERKAWNGKLAPKLPDSWAGYLHDLGPAMRGDEKWHEEFWTGMLARRPAEESLWASWLASNGKGERMASVRGLAAALIRMGMEEALDLPGGVGEGAAAAAAVSKELAVAAREWKAPSAEAAELRCWSASKWPDSRVEDRARELFASQSKFVLESARDLGAGPFARLAFDAAARSGKIQGMWSSEPFDSAGASTAWSELCSLTGADPGKGVSTEELRRAAKAVAGNGARQAAKKVVSLSGAASEAAYAALSEAAAEALMDWAEKEKALGDASAAEGEPGRGGLSWWMRGQTVKKRCEFCRWLGRASDRFWAGLDERGDWMRFLDAALTAGALTAPDGSASVRTGAALFLETAKAALDRGIGRESIDWDGAWKAHAEGDFDGAPKAGTHLLLLALSTKEATARWSWKAIAGMDPASAAKAEHAEIELDLAELFEPLEPDDDDAPAKPEKAARIRL